MVGCYQWICHNPETWGFQWDPGLDDVKAPYLYGPIWMEDDARHYLRPFMRAKGKRKWQCDG